MALEAAFVSVLASSSVSLVLSIGIEQLMTPRPVLARPWAAWSLHAGLWLSVYAALTLVLGRPWFAVAAVSAVLLTLVLVNNAKVKALREPFVFQDYEYFTDAIRHPRLYIPFLGWWKFLGAATGFILAVSIGFWGEATPVQRFAWSGQLGGVAVVFTVGLLLVQAGSRKSLVVSVEPGHDVRSLGLLACFWHYGKEDRMPLLAASSFDSLVPQASGSGLPHLVAVQSESFFDPRSLYYGIRSGVLAGFDRLKQEALAHGKLRVPAWGANTVRTEFAFLSGIGQDNLGVHRFNPYRAIAAGCNLPSLASHLKRLGYRTICIHPYPASFYRRDRAYPRLGFDEFLDIRAFDDSMRYGPYIGDAAVADKIAAILQEATSPTFIFAITMENHGPLHLERVTPSDIDALYSMRPPEDCDDLTIYLRHLRNADGMITKLRHVLEQSSRPASLCWFGDHVPIMPKVYDIVGLPDGEVEYLIWSNRNTQNNQAVTTYAHDLAAKWLALVGC